MSKYVNELQNTINKYFTDYENIENDLQKLEDKRADLSDEFYYKQLTEFKGKFQVLKDMAIEKVEKVKEEFYQAVDDWSTPKGEQLNNDDIKLLAGYITLSEYELEQLGNKYQSNLVMQRAIKEYAEKNNIYYYNKSDTQNILNEYNTLNINVNRAIITGPEGYWGRLLQLEDYFKPYSDTFSILD